METIEYTFHSRADWRSGVWDSEPDKRQWSDGATGLPCLIVRSVLGALCGYVGVAPGHVLHGQHYDDAPLTAHGGLSYSAFCQPGEPDHGVCHRPAPGEPEPVWWFGFDCAHSADDLPYMPGRHLMPAEWQPTYRTFDYVSAECAASAAQIAAAATESR